MKEKTKRLLLVWGLLTASAILVLIFHLAHKQKVDEKIIEKEGVYRIGNVSADTKKGEIWFKGKVFKAQGRVQHLVYLEGYKWLKDESAIKASARLVDLQRAIAILDWKLWDEIYYGKEVSRNPSGLTEHSDPEKQENRRKKLLFFIQWDKKETPAQELVLTGERLEIENFIFLGSPYFDHIALGVPSGVDCRLCPLFALEEKALRELFVRESGQSGYELNSERMPFQGTGVTIIIRLPK